MAEPHSDVDETEDLNSPGSSNQLALNICCSCPNQNAFGLEMGYNAEIDMGYKLEIDRQFREGHSREQLFINLCEFVNITQPGIAQAIKFFHFMDNQPTLKDNPFVCKHHEILITTISERFKKYQNAVAIRSVDCPHEYVEVSKFVDPHYSLYTKVHVTTYDVQFLLFDNYLGRERRISIEGNIPKCNRIHAPILEIIPADELLFVYGSVIFPVYSLCLFHLDVENEKLTVLDGIQFDEDIFPKIILDSKNSLKFAVLNLQENSSIWVVEIKNRKLVIDSHILLHDDPLDVCRLEANKLQALISGFDPEDPNIDVIMDLYLDQEKDDRFGELDLVPSQNYPPIRKLFDVERKGRLNGTSLHDTRFFWLKNICVVIGKETEHCSKFPILIINLDTHSVITSNHYLNLCANIVDIYFNDDGILSVCAKNDTDHEFVVYRLALSSMKTNFAAEELPSNPIRPTISDDDEPVAKYQKLS